MAKIMVADPSSMIRASVKRFLVNAGHIVVGEASTTSEVTAKFKRLRPDLLILDMVIMPDMDAIPGLKAVKAIDPKATVVMLSMGMPAKEEEARRLGASGSVKKPISESVFVDEVNRVLRDIGKAA